MNIFKLIKLGYKLVKKYKKNEKPGKRNIFGDDPENYGVEDLEEKTSREHRAGEKFRKVRVYDGKEGGQFTYVEGEKFDFPGHPRKDIVLELEKMKRMIPTMIDGYYPFFRKFCLEPNKYSKSVREVYRLMTILIERENGHEKLEKMWTQIRDMVCILLEYDSAYRWRAQDIAVEAKLDEIKMTEGDEYYAGKIGRYKWRFFNKKNSVSDKDNQLNNKNHEKK